MIRSTIVGFVVVICVARVGIGLKDASIHWQLYWEQKEETVRFQPKGLESFQISTTNGTVEFEGQNEAAKEVEIVALRKVGANSPERARHALDALEVTVEGKDSKTCRLGWRWRKPKEPDWSATVNFVVRAPQKVNLNVESTNGRVVVKNLAGNAKITTTNGQIDSQSVGDVLDLKTTNGRLIANFSGRVLKMSGTNGQISANISRCERVEGEIVTTNGLVELTVGPKTVCELAASTTNGAVLCQPDLKQQIKSRRSLHGQLGSGGGKLTVRCTNGAIHIRDANFDSE